jgi:hypothetical protein
MSIGSDDRFIAKMQRMTTAEIERINPLLLGARKRQLRDAELRRRFEADAERRHRETVSSASGPTWMHWVQVISMAAGVLMLVIALIGLMVTPAR